MLLASLSSVFGAGSSYSNLNQYLCAAGSFPGEHLSLSFHHPQNVLDPNRDDHSWATISNVTFVGHIWKLGGC